MLKDDKNDIRSLRKRYLFWLYKTTKDELDKIDRKFTQLAVDRALAAYLKKKARGFSRALKASLEPFCGEWEEYILHKESDARKLKFAEDGSLDAHYLFLRLKLQAIEQATQKYCGKKDLACFKGFYEEAAMKRILEDASGKR
jgi:tRNA U38,U39,U40 pseudouridine synthase TruA